MTRLLDGTVTVSWTETHQVGVGVHDCDVCGKETPPPTQDVLLRLMRDALLSNGNGYARSYIWPDRDQHQGYQPVGWAYGIDGKLWCDECVATVKNALAARVVLNPHKDK